MHGCTARIDQSRILSGEIRPSGKRATKQAPVPANQKTQDAVRQLRKDYALGLAILKKCPKSTKSDGLADKRINDEAERHQLNPDTIRKLRQMVEPDGYTQVEFEELCRLCFAHNHPLGRSHVFKFMTVPRGSQRRAFQSQAIKNGWTMGRIRQELRRQFGHRRQGGRRPRLPVNVPDALSQLDEMCLAWTRWYDLLAEAPDRRKKRCKLSDLPDPVHGRLVQAKDTIRDLRTAVQVCLEQARAGRQGGGARRRQRQIESQAGRHGRKRARATSQGLLGD